MRKIHIYNWAYTRQVEDVLTELGYEQNLVTEGDIFEVAKQIYNKGLNIMIVRGKDDVDILFVDNMRFQGR